MVLPAAQLRTGFYRFSSILTKRTMATQIPVDGVVVGVLAGKTAEATEASSLASLTSVDIASQWANSRASATKPGQVRVFYPSKVSNMRD